MAAQHVFQQLYRAPTLLWNLRQEYGKLYVSDTAQHVWYTRLPAELVRVLAQRWAIAPNVYLQTAAWPEILACTDHIRLDAFPKDAPPDLLSVMYQRGMWGHMIHAIYLEDSGVYLCVFGRQPWPRNVVRRRDRLHKSIGLYEHCFAWAPDAMYKVLRQGILDWLAHSRRVRPQPDKTCGTCKAARGTKVCPLCWHVYYCSSECYGKGCHVNVHSCSIMATVHTFQGIVVGALNRRRPRWHLRRLVAVVDRLRGHARGQLLGAPTAGAAPPDRHWILVEPPCCKRFELVAAPLQQ